MIKRLINKTFLLYGVLVLIAVTAFNHKKLIQESKISVLNRTLPPFQQLINDKTPVNTIEESTLVRFQRYYTRVTDYIPNRADAYSMLGYIQFHLNNDEGAITAYKEAIKINPHVFWFHYNLGLLYLKQNQSKEALREFRQALETNPKLTLIYISQSRVYWRIYMHQKDFKSTLTTRLKQGFLKARYYTAIATVRKTQETFPLQMF